MPDGGGIDLAAAIEGADTRKQIAERENALHRARLEPETIPDLLDTAPRLDERDKRFPLADLVGLHPRKIFEHRRFERICIVALVQNGERNGQYRPTITRHCAAGGK